jgi:hypothetical protein
VKFLIVSSIFISVSASAVCVPGEMSCSTQCEVVVNGNPQTYTCGGDVYCDSNTGYCDVDINGIRVSGKLVRGKIPPTKLPQTKNKK